MAPLSIQLITRDQLKQVMPQATDRNIELFEHPLNDAMVAMKINTSPRVAAFIAQIAHESQQLLKVVESTYYNDPERLVKIFPHAFANKSEALPYIRNPEKCANRIYANRLGNGNEASGDGFKYKGRGLIQITGKFNYEQCGKALGIDFVVNPEFLESPLWSSFSAAWFFKSHSCCDLADVGSFGAITRKINPGNEGAKERLVFYRNCKKALGVVAVA